MLTLSDFEDEIDPIILKRGYNYFESGKIEKLQNNDGDILAIVAGTDKYEVKVKIAGVGIVKSCCDCPFEGGDYCKHEVAVFYALMRGRKQKEKTTASEELNDLSKEELLQLVKKGISKSNEFNQIIETESLLKNPKSSKDEYKRIIRESVNSAKRGGFIDWDRAGDASDGANRLLEHAENTNKTNLSLAIEIYQAVIEVMVPTLQSADDSNGAIGDCIEYSFELLEKISRSINNIKTRKDLYSYCLKEFNKKKYEGWDYPLRFLSIAGNVCDFPTLGKLFETMDNYIAEKTKDNEYAEYLQGYDMGNIANIKLCVIKRLQGVEATDRFILENLHLENILEVAIALKIERDDLVSAKQLAREGANKYSDYVGLKLKYLKILLKIARLEKDIAGQKNLLLDIFLSDPHKDFQNYDQLKKSVMIMSGKGI